MKLIRNIAGILLAAVILGESLGMQLIRDICMPCSTETMAVQIPFDSHESDCCRQHKATKACNAEHQHQKEVHFFSKNADFVKQNSTVEQKLVPAVLITNNLQSNIHALGNSVKKTPRPQKVFLPPDDDPQAILSSFLI